MERRVNQQDRAYLSRMTQPELENLKKGWTQLSRFYGLLTLGAIVYVTTEALSGELKFTQFSDVMVTAEGTLSAFFATRASNRLSLIKEYIVPPISTR